MVKRFCSDYLRLILSTAGLLILIGMTEAAWSETLSAELTRLMAEHPKLAAARQGSIVANADVESAKGAFYPTLSVHGNTGENSYEDSFRTGGRSTDLTRRKATVELTQNIFSGYQHEAGLEESRSKQQLATYGVNKAEQELLLKGVLAYQSVLHYGKQLSVAEEKAEVARRYLALREGAQRVGGGTSIEVFEARLGLQYALQKQLEVDTQYRIALGKYEDLFGHAPIPDDMAKPELPSGLIPDSLAQALETAQSKNTNMTMAEERIRLARHRKKSVAGEYWPSLDLRAMYDYEKNKQGIEGRVTETYLYLNMSWDFNLANQTGSKLRSAKEKVMAERYNHSATVKEETNRVRRAWDTYQAANQRKALSHETLTISNDVLAARREQRKKGTGDESSVLNSKGKMLSAMMAHVEAEHGVSKAAYELIFSIGLMSPAALDL